ncbi:hypothetical protein KK137_12785 [Croceibacterium sp. LX-88]|uniref:SCP domain-containing protein n=1 Tax=Croceibacterium selenioxidans TaxID=2838833 RepID=A0ABS5W636_9SPHN|nr:hypothetical protein [Croceibacterium selenioxidans]MBT2135205.1 hypothetical protein [Croceibacterium selenioxidans]
MIEGKPPLPDASYPLESEGCEAGNLRPLRWDELVARLSAARDLHAEWLGVDQGGEGSFDADSARKIAAHHNGKPTINLEGSANFKSVACNAATSIIDAGSNVSQGAVRK